MSSLSTVFVIAGLYLIAVASPGPNFFVITQLSLSGQKRRAIMAACGIAAGSVIWALLAMCGVAALLAKSHWLYAAVRLAGGFYLVWPGLRLLRGALRDVSTRVRVVEPASGKSWRSGLLTSLTNPKSGAFWTSIFATAFPSNAPLWLYVTIALMIACLSTGWHVGLAVAFTSRRVRASYQKLRRPIDAICGFVLVGFGVRLAASR
jgi:RhtB (resistance to homoserine/threonine) family protein